MKAKKIAYPIVVIASFAIVYAAASFISMETDPKKWEEFSRMLYILVSVWLSAFSVIGVFVLGIIS